MSTQTKPKPHHKPAALPDYAPNTPNPYPAFFIRLGEMIEIDGQRKAVREDEKRETA